MWVDHTECNECCKIMGPYSVRWHVLGTVSSVPLCRALVYTILCPSFSSLLYRDVQVSSKECYVGVLCGCSEFVTKLPAICYRLCNLLLIQLLLVTVWGIYSTRAVSLCRTGLCRTGPKLPLPYSYILTSYPDPLESYIYWNSEALQLLPYLTISNGSGEESWERG